MTAVSGTNAWGQGEEPRENTCQSSSYFQVHVLNS